MSHQYCFYLSGPSTPVGQALVAIASALESFGYAHILSVSRYEPGDDDQPGLSGFRSLATVADEIDAWSGAFIQFVNTSPTLELFPRRTTNALYTAIFVSSGEIFFTLLKKEDGDVFRRLMVAIADSIDADVGCGSYELSLTEGQDGETDHDLYLILRNNPGHGEACEWGLLRQTEATEETRVAMRELGLAAVEVGNYVVFEDVEGIGIDQ